MKILLRSSAILNVQNDDKLCFFWSILAHPHTKGDSENGRSTRVSTYRQNFDELNIEGNDFSNGFKFSHVHKFGKLNNFSINIFELSLY